MLLAAAPLAHVSAAPAKQAADPVRNFVRGAPLPKWAMPVGDIPATTRDDPVVIRLIDTQAWVGASPAVLYNRAIQVNERGALATIGQFGIAYFPSYQKLLLHRVAILRDGKVLDRTANANLRPLQRETSLENSTYEGATSMQLLLDDVRVGDTLWMTYTVEGDNPVFGKRWSGDFHWDAPYPIELRRVTLLHPRNRPLYWEQKGDVGRDKLVPTIEQAGDSERLRFEGRGIEPVEPEALIPPEVIPLRMLQFSEYRDWSEVAAWADSLFPRQPAAPALKQLAQKIAGQGDAIARASAALHWVQDEIRYFSVSIGENSHRPQTPDTVLKRRYGDCKDKSYLLVSLLAELGIEAQPVLLSAHAPRLPGRVLPSPSWFDHVIVRVRIDGRDYYVDPTRNGQKSAIDRMAPAFPGAVVLPVSTRTTALVTLPEWDEREPRLERIEDMRVERFDGDAVMEMRDVFRAEYADYARQRFAGMTSGELKRETLGYYEKRYPGIKLAEPPKVDDDTVANRVELRAVFTVPKPVEQKEGKYSITYDSAVMAGAIDLPANLQREFPLAMPRGKIHSRYRLNLTWPALARFNEATQSKAIDTPYF
jgi:transglutaminase-like putative cysteine protease